MQQHLWCYNEGMNLLFSPEDVDLAELRWHKHSAGYAVRWNKRVDKKKKAFAHRVVLERKIGRPLEKGEITDHINRDKLDNRRENLRVADKSLNTINRDKRPDNTTGYVGVYLYWPKKHQAKGWGKRYVAQVYRNGKANALGWHYKTPLEAHKARKGYLERAGNP